MIDGLSGFYFIVIMPRERKGNFSRIDTVPKSGNNSHSVLYQFPGVKTSFYALPGELIIIAQTLFETGLRASEVLNLVNEDLKAGCKLHINSLKRSREREIEISPRLYSMLLKHSTGTGQLFRSNYREIYRFIKSGKTGLKLIKNKKNFSVCHTLRKLYIRHQLYELGKTVDEITAHIGWLKKTSILYYI